MDDTTRSDRLLRIVMWCDAALSVAMVVIGVLGAPVVAVVAPGPSAQLVLALAALVSAALLAGFGAVTAVALMIRMHHGVSGLPAQLWLPLPDPLRPAMYRRRSGQPAPSAGSFGVGIDQ